MRRIYAKEVQFWQNSNSFGIYFDHSCNLTKEYRVTMGISLAGSTFPVSCPFRFPVTLLRFLKPQESQKIAPPLI